MTMFENSTSSMQTCLEPNCNIGHKWLQPGVRFISAPLILVTSMVIPELRGITTVYATHRVQRLKHS